MIEQQEITYETIDGKWWEWRNGVPFRELSDREAADVIWGKDGN